MRTTFGWQRGRLGWLAGGVLTVLLQAVAQGFRRVTLVFFLPFGHVGGRGRRRTTENRFAHPLATQDGLFIPPETFRENSTASQK